MSTAGKRHRGGDSANTEKLSSRDGKPFSISLGGGASKSTANRTKPPPKRHEALRADSDSEDEHTGVHELVTSFDHDAGGAITANRKEPVGPRIIAALPNKDWRAEARRLKGKNLLPPEIQAMQNAEQNGVSRIEEKPTYGLIVSERKTEVEAEDGDVQMVDEHTEATAPRTADDEAMEALVSGSDGRNSTLVISASTDTNDWRNNRVSEAAAFKNDVANRPDQASLDQYNAVPIEGFGAAMLRGMGWKEGEGVGKGKRKIAPTTTKVYGKRQALLGIGAKPTAVQPEELGAWGVKKGRIASKDAYNPVVLKSKATGELLTEEELKAKRELARVEESLPSSKSRDRDRDNDRDRNGRSKNAERDYDRLRITSGEQDRDSNHSSRRDDDKDRYKSRDKGSRRGDDIDRDRQREKDRDRDRHRDRDRDRDRLRDKDRDRDRNRRHRDRSEDRYKERDRDRDRSSKNEQRDKNRSRYDRESRDGHRDNR